MEIEINNAQNDPANINKQWQDKTTISFTLLESNGPNAIACINFKFQIPAWELEIHARLKSNHDQLYTTHCRRSKLFNRLTRFNIPIASPYSFSLTNYIVLNPFLRLLFPISVFLAVTEKDSIVSCLTSQNDRIYTVIIPWLRKMTLISNQTSC